MTSDEFRTELRARLAELAAAPEVELWRRLRAWWARVSL